MHVPSVVFRQYDIRGVVDEQLRPDLAHAVGRAVATEARKRLGHRPRLAIGRDNRPSGERLASAVREGVAAAGGIAVDVGMLPTPALYFALEDPSVDGGIQVTGSHNPPEFNGFKMVVGGKTLHGDDIQGLRHIIEAGLGRRGYWRDRKRAKRPDRVHGGRAEQKRPTPPPGQGSGRLRERCREPGGRAALDQARRRRGAAVLCVGRHVSESPSRSDGAGESR